MGDEIKIIKNRFLFVFEPHEWFYLGGAVGVMAETFDDAVSAMLNSTVLSSKGNKYKAYHREQFFISKNSIAGDIKHKWVMIHRLITNGSGPAMILFDNWNYKHSCCNK